MNKNIKNSTQYLSSFNSEANYYRFEINIDNSQDIIALQSWKYDFKFSRD